MASVTKIPETGKWKALIRKVGWPTASKTFRTKRDAEDWARRIEDEMVRGVYIQRTPSERMTIREALARYEKEIVPTKRESTQRREGCRIRDINAYFGDYSLAAVTPDLAADSATCDLAPANPTIPCVWNSLCLATCSPLPSRNGISVSPTTRLPTFASPARVRAATDA